MDIPEYPLSGPYDVQHTVPLNVWEVRARWTGRTEQHGGGFQFHSSSLGPAPKSNLFTSLKNKTTLKRCFLNNH